MACKPDSCFAVCPTSPLVDPVLLPSCMADQGVPGMWVVPDAGVADKSGPLLDVGGVEEGSVSLVFTNEVPEVSPRVEEGEGVTVVSPE